MNHQAQVTGEVVCQSHTDDDSDTDDFYTDFDCDDDDENWGNVYSRKMVLSELSFVICSM